MSEPRSRLDLTDGVSQERVTSAFRTKIKDELATAVVKGYGASLRAAGYSTGKVRRGGYGNGVCEY